MCRRARLRAHFIMLGCCVGEEVTVLLSAVILFLERNDGADPHSCGAVVSAASLAKEKKPQRQKLNY